jgi:LysR family transcriptional regulator, glycine cleavage system transcriptional activator
MSHSLFANLPPMECLIAALAAARCGSFSQAALELGVTHAAISRRVATAEHWSGTSLFVRHGRGIALTADGQRILRRIEQALDIVEEAADNGWRKAQRIKRLRIATTHSLAQIWLIEKIPSLEARLPGTYIEVLTDHRNVDLSMGEAEIALRCGRGNWKAGREQKLFSAETVQPVTSKQCLGKFNQTLTAKELLSLPLIHDGDTSVWRNWFAAQGVSFKTKPTDRAVANYALALKAACEGLGVALLNNAIGCRGLSTEHLITLNLPAIITPKAYYVIVHDSQQSQLVHQCAQLLLSDANND